MTHGHTKPSSSTPMLTGPEGQGFAPGPTGSSRQQLGPWGVEGASPPSEIRGP